MLKLAVSTFLFKGRDVTSAVASTSADFAHRFMSRHSHLDYIVASAVTAAFANFAHRFMSRYSHLDCTRGYLHSRISQQVYRNVDGRARLSFLTYVGVHFSYNIYIWYSERECNSYSKYICFIIIPYIISFYFASKSINTYIRS